VTAERAALLRELLGLPAIVVEPVGAGWDFDTYEVDGRWIFRFPRRPEVDERTRREIEFLPKLAGALPVSVPRFEFVSLDPVLVGYRKLGGEPMRASCPAGTARDVARFLSELHSFPLERAFELRLGTDAWRAESAAELSDLHKQVAPLLTPEEAEVAAAMFHEYLGDGSSSGFEPALVHADLGPEHLLSDGDRLTGVIDWTDARIGDPALDFAWLLHGPDPAFADALVESYDGRVDEAFRRRASFFHRVGPWHEVIYGLSLGDERFVRSGLEGVRARLGLRG
jgi:aminoglycoside phosphotransferase (APT) family kinase protein